MQRQEQFTADAAFKFALWCQLLAQQPSNASNASDTNEALVDRALAAHVARVALPAVRAVLPRRVVQPCCMTGVCVPRGPLFTHAALHPGRAEVRLTHPIAVRDEACWCVAHFAASGVPQPVVLSVHRYRATEAEARRPHQGLRCLLTHVQCHHIELTDVQRWQDAQAVLAELASLLLRQGQASATTSAVSGPCTSLRLCDVPTPGHAMSRFLRLAAAVDGLTSLSLESCGMSDLHAMADYVRHSRTLAHLDLRRNDHLALTDWVTLGSAVCASASVSFLGLAGCGWGPAHVEAFLPTLHALRARPGGLVLDLSAQRGVSVAYCLTAFASLAPPALHAQLKGLLLCDLETPDSATAGLARLAKAQPEVAAGAGVALFFSRLAQVDVLALAAPAASAARGPGGMLGAALEASVCQRVLRGVAERHGSAGGEGGGPAPWRRLDLSGQSPAPAALKRLLQAEHFAAGATLRLSRVPLGEVLGKLPGLGACVRQLHRLDVSSCLIGDAALTQLATAIERAAPLPLHTLNLDDNPFENALPFLCKALRAHCLPQLCALHLSGTRLSVRPTLTLLDQVSPTLQSLVTHATTFADSVQDRTLALTALARRQRGEPRLRFEALDWWCAPSAGRDARDEPETHARELQNWLQCQSEVRLLRRME